MYELTHRVTDCRKLAVFLSAYVFSIAGSQCHPSTEPHYVKHGVGTAAHSGRLYVLVFIMYNLTMLHPQKTGANEMASLFVTVFWMLLPIAYYHFCYFLAHK